MSFENLYPPHQKKISGYAPALYIIPVVLSNVTVHSFNSGMSVSILIKTNNNNKYILKQTKFLLQR